MKVGAAIALLALALPAFAQHRATHGGSFGSRGFAGHAGFSAHSGFSQPGRFAGSFPGYRAFGTSGWRASRPPNVSGLRTPYSATRFMPGRPSWSSWNAGAFRNRDRDRFRDRRRSFANWYANIYPGLGYGYPWLLDPGFYDWGDSDDSASENSAYNQSAPSSIDAAPPYPQEAFAAPNPPAYPTQRAASVPAQPLASQPLTVIFKGGRAPEKVQNYMMTARVLTDLDSQHYERIPLDQIDLAATQRANSAAGVEFQVPGAARD
ncbi:MAG TPA: hypothetical protein VL967_01705 [Terracidiphilus sp.]|nr:hypothetical protein [Terracidiphilus sp.]